MITEGHTDVSIGAELPAKVHTTTAAVPGMPTGRRFCTAIGTSSTSEIAVAMPPAMSHGRPAAMSFDFTRGTAGKFRSGMDPAWSTPLGASRTSAERPR